MIIIETPTEPTRERLVLVPPLACTDIVGKPGHLRVSLCDARDATPEDLARGGYVPQGSRQDLDCVISDLTAQVRDAIARAEKAERERDAAIALADALDRGSQETRRILDAVIGEPTAAAATRLHNDWVDTRERAEKAEARAAELQDRCDERARQQDRATDEELERAYSVAYARAWESELSTPDRGERAGILAVAAHVRGERCLVARAVAVGEGFSVTRRATGAGWRIRMVGGPGAECAPADVPSTLARLLGEVGHA